MSQFEPLSVAVIGATGAVGREMISILEQRNFPVSQLRLFASENSAGSGIPAFGRSVVVEEAAPGPLPGVDVALFSAGSSVSKSLAGPIAKNGTIVIDNSSAFRMDDDVPLVVPEVNANALRGHRGIIANPNCSTIQMVLALKPLHDQFELERVVVSTYQAVSGTGAKAIEELRLQTKANLEGQVEVPAVYPTEIAFNIFPHIDEFEESGYTREEMKLVNETRKIMNLDDLPITATAARTPVVVGHSESVNLEFKNAISPETARRALEGFPGIRLLDQPDQFVYPTARLAAGQDDVLVGRIRRDFSVDHGLNLWIVGDNLRKGAALNAVQIAEKMAQDGLLKPNRS